jgi:hypothetical protein
MKEPEASNAEFMLMLLAAIERRDIELVIWNGSSSHYIMARISVEESACGKCSC